VLSSHQSWWAGADTSAHRCSCHADCGD